MPNQFSFWQRTKFGQTELLGSQLNSNLTLKKILIFKFFENIFHNLDVSSPVLTVEILDFLTNDSFNLGMIVGQKN